MLKMSNIKNVEDVNFKKFLKEEFFGCQNVQKKKFKCRKNCHRNIKNVKV